MGRTAAALAIAAGLIPVTMWMMLASLVKPAVPVILKRLNAPPAVQTGVTQLLADLRLSTTLKAYLATRGSASLAGLVYGFARKDWDTSKRLAVSAGGILTNKTLGAFGPVSRLNSAFRRLNETLNQIPLQGRQTCITTAFALPAMMQEVDNERLWAFPATASRARFSEARLLLTQALVTSTPVLPALSAIQDLLVTSRSAGIDFVGVTRQYIMQLETELPQIVQILKAGDILTGTFPYEAFFSDRRLCDWPSYLSGMPDTCTRSTPLPSQQQRHEDVSKPDAKQIAADAVTKYLLTSRRPGVAERYRGQRNISTMSRAELSRLYKNLAMEAHPNKNPAVSSAQYAAMSNAVRSFLR